MRRESTDSFGENPFKCFQMKKANNFNLIRVYLNKPTANVRFYSRPGYDRKLLLRHPLIHIRDEASMTWYVMNDEAASPSLPTLTDWKRSDL